MKKTVTVLSFALSLFVCFKSYSQNRVVFNSSNVYMKISNNANLVVDNPNTNAITTSTGANIISEGENNVVKWNIGTGTGTYTVPFTTNSLVKIPLKLNITTAGVGTATSNIVFSTYETATDLNTAYPSDVTNMNSVCTNSNALYAVDRFWKIDAGTYTTKPTPVISFGFDPAANETGVTNTINTSKLKAERFNSGASSWETPMKLYGISAANAVGGASVTPSDFFKSWTLIDTTIMTVPISLTSASSPTICEGSSAIITPTGATTYTLMTGALTSTTNFTVSPVSTTIYTITGSVGSGTAVCKSVPSSAATVAVNVNATPTISTSGATSATICSGQSYTISGLSGGTGNYTLTNTGATSATQFVVTPTSNTTYTVIGANASSCISLASSDLNVSITVNTTPTLSASSISSSTICSGQTVTFTPAGGAATYTLVSATYTDSSSPYTDSPSATTTYTLMGTGANGCVSTLSTQQYTANVTVSASPTLAASSVSSSTICAGQTVTFTPSGGATSYTLVSSTYTDSSSPYTDAPTTTTTYTLSGTASNGCISSLSTQQFTASITVNTTPTVTSSGVTSATLCSGDSFTITPSGSGTGSYTLAPGNLTTTTDFVVSPSSNTTYSVIGANSNGCISTTSSDLNVTLTVNSTPTVNATFSSNALCASQNVTITMSGANVGYTVYPGPTAISAGTASLVITPTAGTTIYTITAVNSNGCLSTLSAQMYTTSVSVVTNPTITASSITNSICAGGTASITPFGATTFTVMPGSYTLTSGQTFTDTPTVPTTYTINGTATGGCVSIASTQLVTTIGINANPTVTAVSALSNTICPGITTTLTASGATSYTWTGGPTTPDYAVNPISTTVYTVTAENASGCSNSSAPTTLTVTVMNTLSLTATSQQDALCFGGATGSVTLTATGGAPIATITPSATSGLSAGTYTYIAIDPLGCTSTTVITISQPTAALSVLSSAETASNSNCVIHNGSASVTSTGGTGTTTVVWDSGSPTGTLVTGLNTGVHTFTITDANGCTSALSSGSVTITGVTGITTAASIQSSVSCMGGANGALTFTTTGGGPDSYTLTSSSYTNTNTTGVFTSLAFGSYTMAVIGNGGCLASQIVNISQPTSSVTLANGAVNSPSVSCFGGTAIVTASVTGGTGVYTYTWNGVASSQPSVALVAGTYTMMVTDNNGCGIPSVQSFSISQPTNSVSVSSVANTTIACNGGTTSVTALATGGSGSYNYTWQGNSSTTNTAIYTGGTYTMTAFDVNGCASATQTITVTQPSSALAVNIVTTAPTCALQTTGMIEIAPVGGTPNYTVLWSNSANTFTLNNLAEGSLSAVVTDANGCVALFNTTIAKENCVVVTIPHLFSPNGDGKNDMFVITGIEQFPNNKIEIFNRWGNVIYTKAPYDNTFEGKANVSSSMGTGLLPSGTYFIIFDFGDGVTPVYKDYFEIKY